MTALRTRTRIINRYEAHYGLESLSFPFLNSDNKVVGTLHSTQKTESQGHPFGRLGHTNADIGGGFTTSICTHKHNCPYIEVWSGGTGDSSFYRGPIFPFLARSEYSVEELFPLLPSSASALNAIGTTAISRVIPTNPIAGLAVTLGELREGFPRLIGASLLKLGRPRKNAAGEYLNWEFGWKPLISDFKKWLHAHRKADRLWAQLERDSGRRVRRDYFFPTTRVLMSSTTSMALPASEGMTSLDFWQGGEHLYELTHEHWREQKWWFKGAFTYILDFGNGQDAERRRHTRRLQYLYGTKITPEVLWNLAPWSWAVDWVANVGDVITNLSRFLEDGLSMPYGYVMENTIDTHLYRMRNVKPKGYHIPDLTQVFTHNVKHRRGATPFGFGLDQGAFTPRQWAIIAAILAKGRR